MERNARLKYFKMVATTFQRAAITQWGRICMPTGLARHVADALLLRFRIAGRFF